MLNKYIKIIIISFLVIFGLVSIFFLSNFSKVPISKNISDWGAIGDYFGGLLNPVISLFSLMLLAYISMEVGKNSVEENKNLHYLEKKHMAYEELTKYVPILNLSSINITRSIGIYKAHVDECVKNGTEIDKNILREYQKDVGEKITPINEYHSFLLFFELRYSHFFKYDFKSDKYKSLIESSSKLNECMNSLYNSVLRMESWDEDLIEILRKHLIQIDGFMNSLKEELS